MPLINAEAIVADDAWTFITGEGAAEQLAAVAADQAIVVDWALWTAEKDTLLARSAPIGVQVQGDNDIAELAADLDKLSLVAIDFPSFADGRGFSQARLLKQRYGFSGEVRAVGDVTWDRLRYMKRCGFDTFAIAEERFDAGMFAAFTEINVCLQGAADDPRPIYRQ